MPVQKKEKVCPKRLTNSQYVLQILKYGLSLIFVKEMFYLLAYYIVNHVKGLHEAHIGKGARIRPTVLLRSGERIYIGDYCTINHNNILWAGPKNAVIRLGKNVITGPHVQIFAFNHSTEQGQGPMIDQPFTEQDVIIGDDVWIGAGSIILAGARIGEGVVVAASSVVTGELPPYTICGGVPARVIKSR